jgi:hypothetical protein
MVNRMPGKFNGAIKFQPLEATLVILGYGAVFVNFIFVLFYIARLLAKKGNIAPQWIVWFNVFILPVQIYFFFFTQ